MILSDTDILRMGSELIEPFDASRVQPASYDLSLHPDLRLLRPGYEVDLRKKMVNLHGALSPIHLLEDGYALQPGECVLAATAEKIRVPHDLTARVEGRSSLGRLFLAVHVTAGWVDPGWYGQLTLEVVNHGPWEVVLWPGMPIAQINFTMLLSPCTTPYGDPKRRSHYQGGRGPTAAVGGRDDEQGVPPQVGGRG